MIFLARKSIKVFNNLYRAIHLFSTTVDTPQSQKPDLAKCSPLMRSILEGVSLQNIVVPSKSNSTPYVPGDDSLRHDLFNFRHMLAGPLLNETNLDKFCNKKNTPLMVDIKYDGQRTLIRYTKGEDIVMISRNGKSQLQVYAQLSKTITQQLDKTDIQSISIDGQILAVHKDTLAPLPFSDLLKQRRFLDRTDAEKEKESFVKLLIYAFDIVQFNGESKLMTELVERRKLIPNIEILKVAEHKIINYPQQRAQLMAYFNEALSRKYEGLIIKGVKDFYYTNDTRVHWKKLKRGFANSKDSRISKIQLDLVVVGANRGQGNNNKKLFTSFLLATPHNGKFIPISHVGSGFTDEMLEILNSSIYKMNIITEYPDPSIELSTIKLDAYFKPELVFEVHAQQMTYSPLYKLGLSDYGGLSLRFPAFKGIRADKGPKQATSGQEILQLSKSFNFNLPQ